MEILDQVLMSIADRIKFGANFDDQDYLSGNVPLYFAMICWNTHSKTICILKMLSTKTFNHSASAFILNLFAVNAVAPSNASKSIEAPFSIGNFRILICLQEMASGTIPDR